MTHEREGTVNSRRARWATCAPPVCSRWARCCCPAGGAPTGPPPARCRARRPRRRAGAEPGLHRRPREPAPRRARSRRRGPCRAGSTMATIAERGPADRGRRPGQVPRRLPRPADRGAARARTSTSSTRSRRRSSATRTRSSSWCSTSPTGWPALERGEVDVVVDHFTVTCDRQRSVEFSSAYMTGVAAAARPGRQRGARGRGPGRAAGVHLARVDDRGRRCAPCRSSWTW